MTQAAKMEASGSVDGRLVAAINTVNREGLLLDRREWQEWLQLYDEHAVFWVPAWIDEDQYTIDPDTQLSIIYHDNKQALIERVERIASHKSVTAMPLPRTTHFVSNIVAQDRGAHVEVTASWTVMIYHPRDARQTTLFGRYIYELAVQEGPTGKYSTLITRKTVILVNDRVPTLLDFYCL